ncbi:hypothetical protein KR059_006484 [Drosophila kikkawai]|nr:hypothetical protein KR059_006484 [Drosophila kikkawai]
MCPNKKTIFILKIFLFMIISIGLLIFLLLWALPVQKEDGNLTDRSKSADDYLQNYADHMKSYMNFSVAPCDNFYEYACGNYPRAKTDHFSVNRRNNRIDLTFTLNDITVQLLGRTYLAETLNVSRELVVAQRFYNACIGAEIVPFPAADPAYLALIRSSGGFPAVDGAAWNAFEFSWLNMSAHLTNYGANGLIYEKLVGRYPFEPYFSLPRLGFDHIVDAINIASNDSRAFQLNDKRMRGYLQAYNLSEERITEVISGVFAFWRDTLKVTKKFNEHCVPFSSEKGLDAYPPLRNYYEIAWNGVNLIEHKDCYAFFAELDKVCNQHPEAVANYLAMQLLYVFDAKLTEAKYQQEHCASLVRESMTFLLDKLYMLELFSEEKRLEVSAMVLELRKSVRKSLEEAEWLDTESQVEALLKESTLKSRVGSLKDEALTDRLIREIASLDIVEDSFATTNINLARHSIKTDRYSSLHFEEMANDTLPQSTYLGMQVQAAYYIIDNSINVMAGILQPPVYHRAWPQSLKFGTLGYIVGHELTHGFDTTSSLFDSKGNIRFWWTKETQRAFDIRTFCFIEQYSDYTIPEIGLSINGVKTKDENIADNGGLRQAFAAYHSHMKQQLEDPEQQSVSEQLPGLDLKPDQLFFLGFAQLFCSDFQEEHYYKHLTDVHTIDKYRVLGAISNSDDFFQAYNCPVGSGMRPENKTCRLW